VQLLPGTGGTIEQYSQYTLRFEGRYDPSQFKDLILEWREGRPIRLGDIADVQVARGKKTQIAIQNGNPAMSLRVDRANGANVLGTLKLVKEAVAELREGPLAAAGLDIQQSFDASVFINRAVTMVTNNLLLGVLLAIAVLWLFLRCFLHFGQVRAEVWDDDVVTGHHAVPGHDMRWLAIVDIGDSHTGVGIGGVYYGRIQP